MKASLREKKVPILMYHSISKAAVPKFRQFTVSPELFAEQMAYLHHYRYTTMTVTQFVSARAQGMSALPERPIVLTFDDGYADFYTAAFPVLKRYDFTATIYIATAFVDGASRWLRRERETMRRMLTWQQVSEIKRSGIECGAHTHSHPQLDTLTASAAGDEIAHSKRVLEDRLGQEVCAFAYPYGYQTARLRQLVQETGYSSACAVRHAMSSVTDDPFCLARLMVREAPLDAFAALLTSRIASPVTAASWAYRRARTPLWQLVRRSSTSMRHYLQGGW